MGTPWGPKYIPYTYMHPLGNSFFPFYIGVSILKLNGRKKGTLIIKGLLGDLDSYLRGL